MGEIASDKPADTWYTGHNQDDNNQYYASKYDKEVFINFYRIELVYNNYHQFFPSKSSFHKHLKTFCLPSNLWHFRVPTLLLTSLLVQISKATLDSIGLGFAFRSWSYTTALVTLSPHAVPLQSDSVAFCCLDMGCNVTFVERE